MRSWVAVSAVAAVAGSSVPARADDASIAAATVLFDEGVKLMDAKRYAEACPKLARSQALAPSGGTLLVLGECYEKTNKVASAWLAYREAAARAASANKRDAEAGALDHARALEPRLPRLAINVPHASSTSGLEVRRDGGPVRDAEYGIAVPLDPGPHELRATAPRKKEWVHTVSLVEGKRVDVDVPPLADDGASGTAGASGAGGASADGDARGGSASSSSGGSAQRTVGLVVGGVGLAGLVAGSVFGLMASSTNDDALSHCPVSSPTTRCDAQGLSLTDDARSQALVSTILFVVGGAAVATGAVVFFTAPSGASGASASASGARTAAALSVTPTFGESRAGAAATLRW